MILSDKSIREEIKKGHLEISPLHEECIGPSSIDLHLSNKFRIFNHSKYPVIDVKEKLQEYTTLVEVKEGEPFIIHPHEFVLGATTETIRIPVDLVGRLDGKSSLGRHGIIIHATAGWAQPGWSGVLTLEIHNVGKIPVALYPGMEIAQISFEKLTTPVEKPYGSRKQGKYQGQTEPTEGIIKQERL